jgi:hypothetical protein
LFGFEFENELGEKVGIQQQVREFYGNTMKQLFGAENVTALNQTFLRANRIYQSATNILNSVQSAFSSLQNVIEVTGSMTGKIGNALKKAGAVFENAYRFFPEQLNSNTAQQQKFQNIYDGIENVSTAVSNLDNIASEVRSVGDTYNEFKTQKDNFIGAIEGKTQEQIDRETEAKAKAKIQGNTINEGHVQRSE